LAGSIAGNFYEGHYRRLQRERDHKLIELVIALETLFSPGREGEQRFRISQRAAILLGKDAEDRKNLMRFFKLVYDARSQIMHSGISAFTPPSGLRQRDLKILTDQQLSDLGNYVREAVMKILILVWRGRKDKNQINDLLDESALDEKSLQQLLQETDIESAMQDLLTS
jgi:hypothetical protein